MRLWQLCPRAARIVRNWSRVEQLDGACPPPSPVPPRYTFFGVFCDAQAKIEHFGCACAKTPKPTPALRFTRACGVVWTLPPVGQMDPASSRGQPWVDPGRPPPSRSLPALLHRTGPAGRPAVDPGSIQHRHRATEDPYGSRPGPGPTQNQRSSRHQSRSRLIAEDRPRIDAGSTRSTGGVRRASTLRVQT